MNPLINSLKFLKPEVDYQALMAVMSDLSHPRRKLKDLQTKGILTRVKKGFYVFNAEFIGQKYSSEIVSNLLYGPSYISMETALAIYKLIPERVENFTSVTSQKNKIFETPIGSFSYQHISENLYPLGVTRMKTFDERFFLIATPEKSLLDYFSFRFSNSTKPQLIDVDQALKEDLRLDLDQLKKIIDKKKLISLKTFYTHRRWCALLLKFLEESI